MENFKINQIDYRYLLVDSYKSLGLSEEELALLLVVDNISREKPTLITGELLALKMNLDEKKLEIMKMVVDGEKSISWAAAKLKRSEKTIRRYRKELLENPNADLVHKNRGREPANKTDHELIWHLYCTRYYGLNITYFCEKLEENDCYKYAAMRNILYRKGKSIYESTVQ